jgi:hypothetical protein
VKTIREAKLDDLFLRLVEKDKRYIGVIIADRVVKTSLEGDKADDVWRRLHDEAGKANPRYFGFDGARARFLRFFPEGFGSADYFRRERDYKVEAKARLDANAPLEEAATGAGLAEAVLSAFQTNMLSPFENMRIRDVLRGATADDFIRAAARFALGEGKQALLAMEKALKPHNTAKWTVVTYLAFLWRPEAHMYLKPEVTQEFAARVGHRFANDYAPQLDMAVYDSLLDLSRTTAIEIADMKPRDRIDVQSFIWAVGRYKEPAVESDTTDVTA